MIRIIIKESNHSEAAHVDGGKMIETFKTFDVDIPAVEPYLREELPWARRDVVGVELLPVEKGTDQ